MIIQYDSIPAVRFQFIDRAAFMLRKSGNDMAKEFHRIVSDVGAVMSREDYYKVSRVGEKFTMNRSERKAAYDMLEEAISRASALSGYSVLQKPLSGA